MNTMRFNERYNTNSYSFESTLNLAERNYFYTRLELLDKQGLLVQNIFQRPGLATEPRLSQATAMEAAVNPNFGRVVLHPDPNEIDPYIFNLWRRVGAFTFGGVRDVFVNRYTRIGLGADVTFYHKTGLVSVVYGERPVSYHIFWRLCPNWLG